MSILVILKSLKQLPSKEKLYSSLTNKKVSDKEYEHVLKVWSKSEMQTMNDYHGLYLKCEVLLLADVFEKCSNNSIKNYRCPNHYLSAYALSWDAMLNMKKVKLKLTLNPEMYIFFEKGMGGGVSYIFNRYSIVKRQQ